VIWLFDIDNGCSDPVKLCAVDAILREKAALLIVANAVVGGVEPPLLL
jgi:Na+-translocating ferredoxin:NAD+ oxidoreductase RNF subunit RnfB